MTTTTTATVPFPPACGLSPECLNDVAALLAAAGLPVTKDLVYSTCIRSVMEWGFSVRDAFDKVLGAGAYDTMAGELYDALRA